MKAILDRVGEAKHKVSEAYSQKLEASISKSLQEKREEPPTAYITDGVALSFQCKARGYRFIAMIDPKTTDVNSGKKLERFLGPYPLMDHRPRTQLASFQQVINPAHSSQRLVPHCR